MRAHQVAVLQRRMITPCHFMTQEHNDVISEREKAQRLAFPMMDNFGPNRLTKTFHTAT